MKFLKICFIIVILMFIGLYFSYKNGYYINKNKENMLYTEEMIKEYENDLKNGVDVSKKNYIVKKDNYENKYTNFTLKLSKKIEKGFDKTIKFLLKEITNSINE